MVYGLCFFVLGVFVYGLCFIVLGFRVFDEFKTHLFLSPFFMHIRLKNSNLYKIKESSPIFMFCRKLRKRSKNM